MASGLRFRKLAWNRVIARDAGITCGSKAVNAALKLLLTVVAAKLLGPSDYGRLAIAMTGLMFMQTLTSLGMGSYLFVTIPQDEHAAGGLFRLALAVHLLASCILVPLAIVISHRAIADPRTALTLQLSAAGVFGLSICETCEAVAGGFREFRLRAVPSLLRNAAAVLGIAGGWILGRDLYAAMVGLAVGYTVAAALSLAVPVSIFRRRREALTLGVPFQALKPALALTVMPLFGLIYFRADIWILSFLSGPTATAVYQLGYSVFDAGLLLPTTLLIVLIPRLSREWATDRAAFSASIRGLLDVLLLASFALSLAIVCATMVLTHWLSSDYARSVPVVAVLSLAVAPWMVNYMLGNAMIIAGHARWPLVTVIAGSVLNVGLNLGLIPLMGTLGSAFATVATEIALSVAQLWMLRRILPKVSLPGDIWKPALPGALSMLVGISVLQLGETLVAAVVGAACVYAICTIVGLKAALGANREAQPRRGWQP